MSNIRRYPKSCYCDCCGEVERKIAEADLKISGEAVKVRLCQDCCVDLFLATEDKK